MGNAQQHGVHHRIPNGAGIADQQRKNQAGDQNQRKQAEADQNDHRHTAGEIQIGHDPVVQSQNRFGKDHQQPQNSRLAKVPAKGPKKELCAAILFFPQSPQADKHGAGGCPDGEKGQ